MDRDRKSTGLKSLQGKIWEEGYHQGRLLGQVYDDVPPALSRWHESRKDICIFSSGSILAQKLLFGNTPQGDLTPFFKAHFDTLTGPKHLPDSYRRIALGLKQPAPMFLYISDITAELDAARLAGMHAVLCVRPESPDPPNADYPVIRSFDEV